MCSSLPQQALLAIQLLSFLFLLPCLPVCLFHIPKMARNSLAKNLLTSDYILYFLLNLSALRDISGVSPDGDGNKPLLICPYWKFQRVAVFMLWVSEPHCGMSAF